MLPEPVVYVVDDNESARQSLQWLLDSVDMKAETFATATDFLGAFDPGRPACLVLDVRMPGMSGPELLERLHAEDIPIPVIIVTAYGDVATTVRSMKHGALDVIEKPFNDQVMIDRINEAIERNADLLRCRGERAEFETRMARLTPRERDVMAEVITGKSHKAIARVLHISPKTVEVHKSRVMTKMEVGSAAELIKTWFRFAEARG